MKFYINTENGSGQKFSSKEDFLKEMSLMIDDCIANGGTVFEISVDADASCFCNDEDGSYITLAYDGGVVADEAMYDNKTEAIEFAKSHNWDEVVNDVTGEVVWKRGDE